MKTSLSILFLIISVQVKAISTLKGVEMVFCNSSNEKSCFTISASQAISGQNLNMLKIKNFSIDNIYNEQLKKYKVAYVDLDNNIIIFHAENNENSRKEAVLNLTTFNLKEYQVAW